MGVVEEQLQLQQQKAVEALQELSQAQQQEVWLRDRVTEAEAANAELQKRNAGLLEAQRRLKVEFEDSCNEQQV